METTLVILKPDALKRKLVGTILARIEMKGLHITGMKMMHMTETLIEEHYDFLKEKPFFWKLKSYMMSGPIIVLAVTWQEAVRAMRQIVGATNPLEANPGSIRWDYALSIDENIIHASDSPENAKKELERFFTPSELFE